MEVNIALLIARDAKVNLKPSGHLKWKGNCPFHEDDHPSFHVNERTGRYKCYACGAEGDAIEYVRKRTGVSFVEAKETLMGVDFTDDEVLLIQTKKMPEEVSVLPVPKVFFKPTFLHARLGYPKRVWEYRDRRGLLGYTCRFEWVDGGKVKKDVLPYSVVRRGKSMKWEYHGFKGENGRPLYGLHKLQDSSNMGKAVIVVEGEKTADALQSVLPTVVVVSWMGGATNVHHTDWSPLVGWDGEVFGWPDNDGQGWCAMYGVAYALGLEGKMRMFGAPEGAPKKWDFADSGWDMATTRAFCTDNMVSWVDAVKGVHDFGDYVLENKHFGWRMGKKDI